ncbi:hypothetical protein DFH08DRAFT_818589 [Mycena albidolilacea]|uniref:Uncharacterized protein n=1 Tax=Mycena albidolilacea TaxID=1033008 RepID=A0AAD7EFM8_9AGAR|nr:hypothetical protein DFH08DRAFT_818589 [Mycena albidolilacea]
MQPYNTEAPRGLRKKKLGRRGTVKSVDDDHVHDVRRKHLPNAADGWTRSGQNLIFGQPSKRISADMPPHWQWVWKESDGMASTGDSLPIPFVKVDFQRCTLFFWAFEKANGTLTDSASDTDP